MDITSDFLLLPPARFEGSLLHCANTAPKEELDQWAARVAAWANGSEVTDGDHASPKKPARPRSARDVFVYFDNDAKVFAPKGAQALAHRVDKTTRPAK